MSNIKIFKNSKGHSVFFSFDTILYSIEFSVICMHVTNAHHTCILQPYDSSVEESCLLLLLLIMTVEEGQDMATTVEGLTLRCQELFELSLSLVFR